MKLNLSGIIQKLYYIRFLIFNDLYTLEIYKMMYLIDNISDHHNTRNRNDIHSKQSLLFYMRQIQ